MVVAVTTPESADHLEAAGEAKALFSETCRGLFVRKGKIFRQFLGRRFLSEDGVSGHAELLEEHRLLCEPTGHRPEKGQGGRVKQTSCPGKTAGIDEAVSPEGGV